MQEACLHLALQHGSIPANSLGSFLDGLLQPQGCSALSASLQRMLLANLHRVVASLSAQRVAPVVRELPALLAACSPSEGSLQADAAGLQQARLQAAAWQGLGACLQQEVAGAPLCEAAGEAAAVLFRGLPRPPQLQPGELLACPASAEAATGLQHRADDPHKALWAAAMGCMAQLPAERVSCSLCWWFLGASNQLLYWLRWFNSQAIQQPHQDKLASLDTVAPISLTVINVCVYRRMVLWMGHPRCRQPLLGLSLCCAPLCLTRSWL